jgi:23S rRNA pseudoU1915 N3-methylase RlmH
MYPIELINPETYKPPGSEKSLYQIANNPNTSPNAAKTARTKLQEKIMEVSNNEVAGHLSRVTSTQVTVNILLGGASTALSGAASLATGNNASTLSELSTVTGAFRSLFNEQVYRNALVETLVAAIASDRNKFLSDIRNLKQTLPIDEYCVQAAIHDMVRYHDKGSFYHGLTLIREAAEAENRKRLQKSTPEAERKYRIGRIED